MFPTIPIASNRFVRFACLATLLAAASSTFAVQIAPNAPQPPAGERPADTAQDGSPSGIPGLLAPNSRPVQVATGFRFTEGPASDEKGRIHFVDVPSGRVLTLQRTELTAENASDNTVDVVVNNGGCFGLAFSADGRLFATQGGSTKGALLEIDRTTKAITILARELLVDGEAIPFGRVNDLAVDAEGGIYFTDPSLGRTPSRTRGILYRAKDGSVRRVDESISAPNGVRLSADGKTLYALSYADTGVYRFAVSAPGTLGAAERFGELVGRDGTTPRGRGDGFAIDERGNLWCTNPDVAQVQVISPEGKLLGVISVPEAPSNCAFGGEDGRTLYITAVRSLYAIRTEVAGTWPARGKPEPGTSPATAPAAPSR
jgi:gluconolactonase